VPADETGNSLAYASAYGGGNGTLYDQIISGDEDYNQTEYSDQDGRCMTGVTPMPIPNS
jgi:hypothetical protein